MRHTTHSHRPLLLNLATNQPTSTIRAPLSPNMLTDSVRVSCWQEAAAEAGPPGSEGHERWRRVLWRYLATVTAADPNASADYHELQV